MKGRGGEKRGYGNGRKVMREDWKRREIGMGITKKREWAAKERGRGGRREREREKKVGGGCLAYPSLFMIITWPVYIQWDYFQRDSWPRPTRSAISLLS